MRPLGQLPQTPPAPHPHRCTLDRSEGPATWSAPLPQAQASLEVDLHLPHLPIARALAAAVRQNSHNCSSNSRRGSSLRPHRQHRATLPRYPVCPLHRVSRWVVGRPALQVVAAPSTTTQVVETQATRPLRPADLPLPLHHHRFHRITSPLLPQLVAPILLPHCVAVTTARCHLQQPSPSLRVGWAETSVKANTELSPLLKIIPAHRHRILSLNLHFHLLHQRHPLLRKRNVTTRMRKRRNRRSLLRKKTMKWL